MGRVVHFEIPSDDPERAIKFYESVFGWTITKWDGPMDYWVIKTGEDNPGIDGGLMRKQDPAQPVVDTISVECVDTACSEIEAAGGTIVMPKFPIPGVGYLAYFKDTEGNIFGVMHSDPSAG